MDMEISPRSSFWAMARIAAALIGLLAAAAILFSLGFVILSIVGLALAAVFGVAAVREHMRVSELTTELQTAKSKLATAENTKAALAKLEQTNVELQRQLAETRTELETARKELEDFTYSVSHDLRAPLRAIDGFARIVADDYAPKLEPKARHYLQIVRESSQQMSALLDGVLTLSRLMRVPVKRRQVDMASLMRCCFEELRDELKGREIEFVVEKMPSCDADPVLLRQAAASLLSNAIKFTRKREKARIEVGSVQTPQGETVYFIRDNGAGFDMSYSDKLFHLFQRLHTVTEFEGAGVGLAIVRQVIGRHGGRVWAEAQTDAGATFFFTVGCDTSSNGPTTATAEI